MHVKGIWSKERWRRMTMSKWMNGVAGFLFPIWFGKANDNIKREAFSRKTFLKLPTNKHIRIPQWYSLNASWIHTFYFVNQTCTEFQVKSKQSSFLLCLLQRKRWLCNNSECFIIELVIMIMKRKGRIPVDFILFWIYNSNATDYVHMLAC